MTDKRQTDTQLRAMRSSAVELEAESPAWAELTGNHQGLKPTKKTSPLLYGHVKNVAKLSPRLSVFKIGHW